MNIIFKNYTLLNKEENVKLLEIRNNKDIRKNMLNQDIISLEEHFNWLKSLKNSKTNIYYAVFIDDILYGGINITRINSKQSTASWGVFFKSDTNPFLPSISTYLFINRIFNTLNIETLNLEVDKLNINAYKFDLNFGFKVYDQMVKNDNLYYLMTMTKEYWNNNKSKGLLKSIQKQLKKVDYNIIDDNKNTT